MTKNLLLLMALCAFFACKNEPKKVPVQTNTTVAPSMKAALDQAPIEKSYEENMAALKANALDVNDKFGRVSQSMTQIQKQFDASNQLKPAKGKVIVSVDENFNLLIRNTIGAEIQETKVNLKNIDHRDGGIRLIPDKELDEWPGFAVTVLDGKKGVQISKNGKKTGEEKELKIFMADRSLIEQAVPALMQALNVVHERN